MPVALTRWQYRIADTDPSGDKLQALDGWVDLPDLLAPGSSESMTIHQAVQEWGQEGWELVSVVLSPGNAMRYVFKKPYQ